MVLKELGSQASFQGSWLSPLCLPTLILSEDHLLHLPPCPQLLRPFCSPLLFSPPMTFQMRLCGLRGMMHCHQMPRTSPLNCSTRTLWRDWAQVGQAPLIFLTTWKREEGG